MGPGTCKTSKKLACPTTITKKRRILSLPPQTLRKFGSGGPQVPGGLGSGWAKGESRLEMKRLWDNNGGTAWCSSG